MKIIAIIFFAVTFISFNILDEEFFSNDSTCNFVYTVDRKYALKLREKDRFMITIQVNDSRYSKVIKDSISGKFLRIADTLIFKSDYASQKYLLEQVQSFRYAYKKDSLIGLKNLFVLPHSFIKRKLYNL